MGFVRERFNLDCREFDLKQQAFSMETKTFQLLAEIHCVDDGVIVMLMLGVGGYLTLLMEDTLECAFHFN